MYMKFLKKIDILFFSFILLTSLLLLLSWRTCSNMGELFSIRVCIVGVAMALIYFQTKFKNPLLGLLRNVYPIVFSGYLYAETVFYNKLLFDNLDPLLEKYELLVFGFQPSIIFSTTFNSMLFSELMYFGYFSFYLLIIGFILCVYFKNNSHFLKTMFLLSSSLYLFYFIFGIFPAMGPQFYFDFPQKQLPQAYFFDKIMHFIQDGGEQPTGAFPSSHVGISLIILGLAKKVAPLFFKIAIPFTIILVMSTVYIKAHYLLDVVAAVLIAPFILWLSEKI